VFSAHQVGAAIVAYLAGVARTVTGDYAMAFNVAGAMAIIAALLILQLNPAERPAEPLDVEPRPAGAD
jgi:sugar phosphate permease